MITLYTLGPARIEGTSPAASRRVLAQPKRWALLAYLAVEAMDAAVTRDRVLGVFWPEVDAGHARGNLRNALHFLRGVVGSDAIVSVGDQLSVPSGALRCDAVDLLRRPTDREELLGSYRGDFLQGIHIDELEFEYWVDGVRSALRARASELAWAEADRAATDGAWITAARYGRRAVELAIDVEAATQRLIRILDAAGDRAAALAEYARLGRSLDELYGVAPSPETEALVEEIRARAAPRAESAPGHTDIGADPDASRAPTSLAVLPFRSLDGDRLAGFARGMAEDLATALTALPGVRVVSRTSVHALFDEPGASLADARDRLGVELALEGSVRAGQDRLRVTVQLVDTATDAQRWAGTYDRALVDLFDVQSDVSLAIARELGVQLSPRTHRRLRMPSTRNVEAHERYVRARHLWKKRNVQSLDEAIAQLEEAVALDPDFALGWAGLADAHLLRSAHAPHGGGTDGHRAREALDRALALDPDSGEARATLGTLKLFFDGDVQGALLEYRRAVSLSPGYATAHHWLGNLLVVDGRADEGFAELSAALDLDPLSALVHENVGLAHAHADDLPRARASYTRAMELDPGYWRAYWADGLALARLDRLEEAVDRMVTAWTLGGHGTSAEDAQAARAALRADGPAAAIETRLGTAAARVPDDRTWRVAEAALLVVLDRPDDAVDALERAHHEGSLPFVLVHAPSFDRLVGLARFDTLFRSLPYTPARWRR